MSTRLLNSAHITDTHGDGDNRELILSIFKQYFKFCRKNKIHNVFHLGDFFIDRRGQGLVALYLVHEVGELAQQYGVTLHIIPGNHDKTDQASPRSYLGIYNHPNFVVHDCAEPADSFVDDALARIRYHLLPFFVDEVYYQKLAALPLRSGWRNVLLTHVGIDGVLNNRGENAERSIPVGDFKQFDLVLIGHYHDEVRVSKRIRYIGSSHQANFAENEAKGFSTLDDDLVLEQHNLNTPRWHKARLVTSNAKVILQAVNKYHPHYRHLHFEFCCSEEEYQQVDQQYLNGLGIRVSWVNTNASRISDMEAEELSSTTAFTPREINKNFLHYCKEQEVTPAQRKLGLSLLKTAFHS